MHCFCSQLPAYMATSPIPDTTHHIIEEGLRELDAHPEYWEPHSTVENPTTNPTELLLFTGIHPRPTQNKKTPRHRRRRKPKHRNNSSTSATGTEDSEFSCESDEETLFPMDLSAGDSDGSNRSTASAPCLAPALHHNDHLHHLVNSEWHGNQFASGCHPFSDGDITPITRSVYFVEYIICIQFYMIFLVQSDHDLRPQRVTQNMNWAKTVPVDSESRLYRIPHDTSLRKR